MIFFGYHVFIACSVNHPQNVLVDNDSDSNHDYNTASHANGHNRYVNNPENMNNEHVVNDVRHNGSVAEEQPSQQVSNQHMPNSIQQSTYFYEYVLELFHEIRTTAYHYYCMLNINYYGYQPPDSSRIYYLLNTNYCLAYCQIRSNWQSDSNLIGYNLSKMVKAYITYLNSYIFGSSTRYIADEWHVFSNYEIFQYLYRILANHNLQQYGEIERINHKIRNIGDRLSHLTKMYKQYEKYSKHSEEAKHAINFIREQYEQIYSPDVPEYTKILAFLKTSLNSLKNDLNLFLYNRLVAQTYQMIVSLYAELLTYVDISKNENRMNCLMKLMKQLNKMDDYMFKKKNDMYFERKRLLDARKKLYNVVHNCNNTISYNTWLINQNDKQKQLFNFRVTISYPDATVYDQYNVNFFITYDNIVIFMIEYSRQSRLYILYNQDNQPADGYLHGQPVDGYLHN